MSILQSQRENCPLCRDYFVKISDIYIRLNEEVFSDAIKNSILNGSYEFPEARNLPYILQPGEIVLELGGGIGFLSTLCAKDQRVKEVITFEANSHLIPVIKQTHLLNGVSHKTTVINAIAEPMAKETNIPFYVRKDFWASSILPTPWGYKEIIQVKVVDLNKIIKRYKPTLLIVDIEGGEQLLFDNINLSGVKKVYIEIHQEVLGRQGVLHLFNNLHKRKYHYDVWHSEKKIILFSQINRDHDAKPENEPMPAPQNMDTTKKLLTIKGVEIYRNRQKPLSFISPKSNNLVYVNNPKSGCTSVKNIIHYLAHNEFPKVDIDVHYTKSDKIAYWVNSYDQNYFRKLFSSGREILFTFVRNPFSRFFFAFYDKVYLDYAQSYDPLRLELKNTYGIDFSDPNFTIEKGCDLFIEYLLSLLEKDGYIRDPYFNLQVSNIRYGEIPYDVIGRVESFVADLTLIFDKANIQVNADIFKIRGHAIKDPSYKKYSLTEKQRKFVIEIYSRDFKAFGYDVR